MTTYYVDSAAGSNTSPYDTWAKAATALPTITAIVGAGEVSYVASTHSKKDRQMRLLYAAAFIAVVLLLAALYWPSEHCISKQLWWAPAASVTLWECK